MPMAYTFPADIHNTALMRAAHAYHVEIFREAKKVTVMYSENAPDKCITEYKPSDQDDNLLGANFCHMYTAYAGLMQPRQLIIRLMAELMALPTEYKLSEMMEVYTKFVRYLEQLEPAEYVHVYSTETELILLLR